MKMFLLFLAFGLAASEKLDRTYLPPPGAKFSGGAPGDIQVPFELPEGISGSQPIFNNAPINPDDSLIEIGINRGIPSEPGTPEDSVYTPGTKGPDFYKVPTTTTSYAFTQTTTHPPSEEFATTVGPIDPVSGLPTTTPFIDFQTTGPGFVNYPQSVSQGQQIVPGYQLPGVPGQRPGSGIAQYPGSTGAPTTVSPFGQNRPGYVGENINQYQGNRRPGFTGIQRPGFSPATGQYQGNEYPGDVTNAGPSSTIPPSFSPSSTTPTSPFGNFNQVQGNTPTSNTQFAQGLPGARPSGQFDNIPSSLDQPQYNAVPGQSGLAQPGFNIKPTQGPALDQYQQNNGGFVQPGSIQRLRPGQNQYQSTPELSQQFPAQLDSTGRPLPGQVFSTASPTTPVPNFTNQYPTTPGSYPTPSSPYQSKSPSGSVYPGITQGNLQNGLVPRPERPQAEADRNAVILDYQSVITPDGEFSYTFDTSNGIHADESGTAANGVKAKGSYSYIGDDGKLYSITYTADENGFQPRGDHLPTSPPIPEAIQRVIEQANRDKNDGVSDDGAYDEDKYGHKKYQGPQKPTKVSVNDDDYPRTNENQYNQENRKGPSSTRGPNNYYENFDEYDQDSRGEIGDSDRQRPIGKGPSRRPVNRFEDENQETYISDAGVMDNANRKKLISKIPSRRPGINQDGTDSDVREDDDNRRKPFGKIPTRKPVSQQEGFDAFNEKDIIDDGTRRRLEGDVPIRRPVGAIIRPNDQSQFGPTYDDGSTNEEIGQNLPVSTSQGGKIQDSRLRPVVKDYSKRPIVSTSTYKPTTNQFSENDKESYYLNEPGQYNKAVKDYGSNTGISRKPIKERPVAIKDTNINENYNQDRRRPQVSTTYAPELESGDSFDDGQTFGSDKTGDYQNVNRPTANRPNEINRYTTTRPSLGQRLDDINRYTTVRPTVGLQPGNVNRYATLRPTVGQQVTFAPQGETAEEYDTTRISIPGKTGQNIRRPIYSQRPEKTNQYNTVRPIEQEESTAPQFVEHYDSRTTIPSKSPEIGQGVRRPIYNQLPGEITKYTTAKPFAEETGYQYIPPQRKFEGSLPGASSSQNKYDQQNDKIPRPFTTPDVTRAEESFDKTDNLQEDRKQFPGSIKPGQQTADGYVNQPSGNQQPVGVYNNVNGPKYYNVKDTQYRDDIYDNKGVTGIPGEPGFTTIGSTRRPYQQTQGYQPNQQLGQQYRPGTEYEGSQGILSGNMGPLNNNDRYFVEKDGEKTFVPSTTPLPSQGGQYEVRQPSRRPGQQNTDRFANNQTPNTQGYDFVSTTRMPPQSQFGSQYPKDIYQQTPSQAPYQTTYRPMTTISSNKGIPGSLGSNYQVSDNRSRYPQSQVPSTTYRPGYFSTEKMNIDNLPAVDNYGRPIDVDQTQRLDGTTSRPGYAGSVTDVGFPSSSQEFEGRQPSVQITGGNDMVPGVTKYRRPLPSGQDQGTSTTEKIIGEDFSGPKQQQRFDPERGYYY